MTKRSIVSYELDFILDRLNALTRMVHPIAVHLSYFQTERQFKPQLSKTENVHNHLMKDNGRYCTNIGIDFWVAGESGLNLSLDKKHLELLACLAFGWTNRRYRYVEENWSILINIEKRENDSGRFPWVTQFAAVY